MSQDSPQQRRILYCHCAFSRVVPDEVKGSVLAGLTRSGQAFEAVPDLCELAARQDPSLHRLAACGGGAPTAASSASAEELAGDGTSEVDIVACYPRAVRWLFHAAEAPLPEQGVRIHNMRADEAQTILQQVLDREEILTRGGNQRPERPEVPSDQATNPQGDASSPSKAEPANAGERTA